MGENGDDDIPPDKKRGSEHTEKLPSPQQDPDISLDMLLDTLANSERRELLRFLSNSADPTVSVSNAVRHILKVEDERRGHQPAYDSVESRLHHIHIPKIAEAGIIDYDPRSREIRYWDCALVEAWLEELEPYEPG